jgi:hypothetical protein
VKVIRLVPQDRIVVQRPDLAVILWTDCFKPAPSCSCKDCMMLHLHVVFRRDPATPAPFRPSHPINPVNQKRTRSSVALHL